MSDEINKKITDFLFKMLINQYGEEITNKIVEGYSKTRKLTFRVNTLKTTSDKIEDILNKNNIEYEKPTWSKVAYIIENKHQKDIENLEIYKNGEIYLQSLSSMLPPIILQPKENTDILDMAAAPRWKNNTNCSSYQ